jgi:hypothetical protein
LSACQTLPGRELLVRRTRPLLPSKLGVFSLCPLRYVLETENAGAGITPPGLMALRGTAAHRAIEGLAGRRDPSSLELRQALRHTLAQTVARQDSNPLIRLAFEQFGVNALFPAEQQASMCQFIRKVLARQVHGEAAATGPITFRAKQGRSLSFGRERKLASRALDMEGRVDLVYKGSSGIVHVCDFKTGNVLEGDGQPKHAYLLQISAYGLLVKDMLDLETVGLELLGPASDWHGGLDDSLELMARQAIGTLQARLPKLEAVSGESLAASGSWCKSCTARPSCPVYVRALEAGSVAEDMLSPFDVAGTVTEVFAAGSYVRLRIVTQTGTRASLSEVPVSLYPRLVPGMRILGFSLGSFDVLTRAAFAANFYIFRRDDPKASAFSSRIIVF